MRVAVCWATWVRFQLGAEIQIASSHFAWHCVRQGTDMHVFILLGPVVGRFSGWPGLRPVKKPQL